MSRLTVTKIVPSLIDQFDRCDPTRSTEMKPSERMHELYRMRKLVRGIWYSFGLVLVLMGVAWLLV